MPPVDALPRLQRAEAGPLPAALDGGGQTFHRITGLYFTDRGRRTPRLAPPKPGRRGRLPEDRTDGVTDVRPGARYRLPMREQGKLLSTHVRRNFGVRERRLLPGRVRLLGSPDWLPVQADERLSQAAGLRPGSCGNRSSGTYLAGRRRQH